MGRFLTLMMLMILGTVAVRTQNDKPNPYMTNDLINGLWWRSLNHEAKSIYVFGVKDGYLGARLELEVNSLVQLTCQNNIKEAHPRWYDAHFSIDDVTREMDEFYENGSNISLPMITGFNWAGLKLSGANKKELEDFLTYSRKVEIR